METSPAVARAIENLQRLASLFQLRREQLAGEVGLTVNQWRVLEQIDSAAFMPSLFAREQACTPANISKTLRQLQQKGLTTVRVSKADGRQREYALTAKGSRTMARLRASRQRAIEAIWGECRAADLRAFARFSDALIQRFEAYVAAVGSPARGGSPRPGRCGARPTSRS